MNEHDETKIVLDGIARQVREISGRYVNLAHTKISDPIHSRDMRYRHEP